MFHPDGLPYGRQPGIIVQFRRILMQGGTDEGIPLQKEDALFYARVGYKFFSSPTLAATSSSIFWLSP